MANMCSNAVWFNGSYEKLKPLYGLLTKYLEFQTEKKEIDLTQINVEKND